ncbi:hypothetical protein HZB02_06020 [Candidatus Woesearchaeota archaeon]|nr:hypothetical protein [Candidatus Woesearchaeota archaeon]
MFTMITERERHHLYYNQKDCRWFRKDSSSVYVLTPETSFHGDVFVWGYTTSQSSDHQSWDTSWGPPKQYDYAHRDKVMYLKSGTGPFIKAPTGVESKVNFFAVARMIDVETWDYLIGDTGGTNGWPGLENELKCYPYLKLAVERLLKK